MKKTIFLIMLTALSFSCKQKDDTKTAEVELSIAELIANANGFESWNSITQIEFTFNVDVDTTHFERSWKWKPKLGDVTLISGKDTISYNRKSVDSTSLNADKAFINDKYWLLAPFQMVWDDVDHISEPMIVAPISKQLMNKITITYPSKGGYTPGDSYDFYFNKDYIIKEWVFRKGNAKEPSMITSWEDYEDFNGIKIAKSHKKPDADWNLYFTNIKVTN